MAYQIDTEFTGTIENLIFYKRNGKFLIRTIPVQAMASQITAKAFGKASSKAKTLRTLLSPLIPFPKDRNMQYRLTTAIQAFLAVLKTGAELQPENNKLSGFRFIQTSDFNNCLKIPISISMLPGGNISFTVPEMNPLDSITAPAGTSRVELQIMAVTFQANHNQSYAGIPETHLILYTNTIQQAWNFVIETKARPGSIIVIAAALRYWKEDMEIKKEGFMPVEILRAFYN